MIKNVEYKNNKALVTYDLNEDDIYALRYLKSKGSLKFSVEESSCIPHNFKIYGFTEIYYDRLNYTVKLTELGNQIVDSIDAEKILFVEDNVIKLFGSIIDENNIDYRIIYKEELKEVKSNIDRMILECTESELSVIIRYLLIECFRDTVTSDREVYNEIANRYIQLYK